MPSAFDCHDAASAWDCKIRIDSHDVYGPAAEGWALEYDSAWYPICLAQSSGRVMVYTLSGRVYDRESSGVWTQIASGLDGGGTNGFGTLYANYPMLCSHNGAFYVSKSLNNLDSPDVYSVATGSTTLQLSANAVGIYYEGTHQLVSNGSALHWMQRSYTGFTLRSGAALTGSWSWSTIVGLGSLLEPCSDETFGGNIITRNAYWSGATTLSRGTIASGSGYPAYGQLAPYSGITYGIFSSGAYRLQTLSGVTDQWVAGAALRQTGSSIKLLGSCKAANGHVYFSYVYSGATQDLYIDDYDIAAGTIIQSHHKNLDASHGTISSRHWFTRTSSAIYMCGNGYIYRKDL